MIGGGVSLYIYPDNLKSKATLWLWELRDIGIVGIGCLISVFALAQLGFILPIVFTAAYEADQIKQRQKEEQAQRGAGPVME